MGAGGSTEVDEIPNPGGGHQITIQAKASITFLLNFDVVPYLSFAFYEGTVGIDEDALYHVRFYATSIMLPFNADPNQPKSYYQVKGGEKVYLKYEHEGEEVDALIIPGEGTEIESEILLCADRITFKFKQSGNGESKSLSVTADSNQLKDLVPRMKKFFATYSVPAGGGAMLELTGKNIRSYSCSESDGGNGGEDGGGNGRGPDTTFDGSGRPNSSLSFPSWAIALIVLLVFVAVVIGIAIAVVVRRNNKRKSLVDIPKEPVNTTINT